MTSTNPTYPSTRKQAILIGSKFYYTGKPCKYGHLSKRHTLGGGYCDECQKQYRLDNKECAKEYNKKYKNDNKERISLQNKHYSKEHKEQIYKHSKHHRENNRNYHYQKGKLYRANNKVFCAQYLRQWQQDNKDRVVILSARYRASKKQALVKWYERELVEQVYSRCQELNKNWNTTFQVDHIIPLQSKTVCGLHCWDNLQLLDKDCNQTKHNSYLSCW